ncbi:MAG: Dna2/Cas4 domain-containing protein [Chloroflexota bacterium]|nr:MAG: Dna2/Cas4 domain-containing protein [Chloroflexota bacterium]
MLYLVGFLLLLGVILYWLSGLQRRSSGLPAGRIIYSDHSEWGKIETPLYDPTFNLTGKPDYMIESSDGIIPVEVKSSRLKTAPYDSHIYQLAAYCLLIEQTFSIRPEYGILNYLNKDIAVDYTTQLEQSVIDTIREMRSLSRRRNIDRSHESVNRCRGCGFNSICEQALN